MTDCALCAGLLFDWLYPAHFPTLRACLEAWADSPDATTAMLKFMSEFALNKTQRLTFDSSSPNGILLFREVSKVSYKHTAQLTCVQVAMS
jgi:exportin-7